MMGQYTLITGISGGVGSCIAEELIKEGHSLIGIDSIPFSNDKVEFFQGDLGDKLFLDQICKTLMDKKIAIKGMVFAAAVSECEELEKTSYAKWDEVMKINLYSAFYLSKSLIKTMQKGSIVNISSVHAHNSSLSMGPYAASKAALNALTRAQALEWASFGIRVNSISPGAIDTPMLTKGLSRSDDAQKARESLIASTPLKRIADPLDIARLVSFLLNDQLSQNITGSDFVCDGGVSAQLASEVDMGERSV